MKSFLANDTLSPKQVHFMSNYRGAFSVTSSFAADARKVFCGARQVMILLAADIQNRPRSFPHTNKHRQLSNMHQSQMCNCHIKTFPSLLLFATLMRQRNSAQLLFPNVCLNLNQQICNCKKPKTSLSDKTCNHFCEKCH